MLSERNENNEFMDEEMSGGRDIRRINWWDREGDEIIDILWVQVLMDELDHVF